MRVFSSHNIRIIIKASFPHFRAWLRGGSKSTTHKENYLKYVEEVPVFWDVLNNRVCQGNQQVSGTNLTCLKF
jgi:hypothetical protein